VFSGTSLGQSYITMQTVDNLPLITFYSSITNTNNQYSIYTFNGTNFSYFGSLKVRNETKFKLTSTENKGILTIKQ
jgi:hypothetical protein